MSGFGEKFDIELLQAEWVLAVTEPDQLVRWIRQNCSATAGGAIAINLA